MTQHRMTHQYCLYVYVCVWQELHARMEPLLIFTIDGANFIDVQDPKWEVVAAVMERSGQQHLVRAVDRWSHTADSIVIDCAVQW